MDRYKTSNYVGFAFFGIKRYKIVILRGKVYILAGFSLYTGVCNTGIVNGCNASTSRFDSNNLSQSVFPRGTHREITTRYKSVIRTTFPRIGKCCKRLNVTVMALKKHLRHRRRSAKIGFYLEVSAAKSTHVVCNGISNSILEHLICLVTVSGTCSCKNMMCIRPAPDEFITSTVK